jgi:hypothetical protein
MRKKYFRSLIVVILGLSLTGGVWAQPEDKNSPVAKEKSDKFQGDGSGGMGAVFRQRDEEEKKYRETMLKNSEEIIRLLKEILTELKQSKKQSEK